MQQKRERPALLLIYTHFLSAGSPSMSFLNGRIVRPPGQNIYGDLAGLSVCLSCWFKACEGSRGCSMMARREGPTQSRSYRFRSNLRKEEENCCLSWDMSYHSYKSQKDKTPPALFTWESLCNISFPIVLNDLTFECWWTGAGLMAKNVTATARVLYRPVYSYGVLTVRHRKAFISKCPASRTFLWNTGVRWVHHSQLSLNLLSSLLPALHFSFRV